MPATIPERCSNSMSGRNGLPVIAALKVLASKSGHTPVVHTIFHGVRRYR